MPQVLKADLRERILRAALEVFAARGFTHSTMAMIAERAGLGTASLYRYYPGKTELFAAAIPSELVREFEGLLEKRVRSLGTSLSTTDPSSEGMLRFWIEHRLAFVILLDRAHDTAYAHFGEQFVDTLVRLTIEQLETTQGLVVDETNRFVLRRIFENTRGMLASILEVHDDERHIRAAIQTFWAYQLAGLRGITEHLGQTRG